MSLFLYFCDMFPVCVAGNEMLDIDQPATDTQGMNQAAVTLIQLDLNAKFVQWISLEWCGHPIRCRLGLPGGRGSELLN